MACVQIFFHVLAVGSYALSYLLRFHNANHYLQQGAAVIHCHAGEGRTGVILAAYLCKSKGMKADKAIAFLQTHRHRSLQVPLAPCTCTAHPLWLAFAS